MSFSGVDFPCVDRGFAREQSVQVVVRPEDIEVVSPVEGQLVGVVNDVIFKGVHFEMHVECEGREWLIHSPAPAHPRRDHRHAHRPQRDPHHGTERGVMRHEDL